MNTKPSCLEGGLSNLSIDELASELKVRLDAAGVMQHGQLIFIAHSMGGLIARDFLLKYSEMADNIRFIFFLSTPTTGAAIANWAELVSRNPQFRNIGRMKSYDYLANIQRNWVDKGFAIKIHSYCAYEKKQTYGTLVVDMGSASSLCNKALVPVQADHFEIAKPADESAIQYAAFRNAFNDEMLTGKLALVDRGAGYFAQKDYSRAMADFNEALRLDPEYIPAIKHRGAIYLNTQDYVRAIEDYNKAIRLEPKYAEHFYNRGAAYYNTQDYDQAIADFSEAIRLNFYNKALALYLRGDAKQRKGDSAGGQADIAAARAIDPNVGK